MSRHLSNTRDDVQSRNPGPVTRTPWVGGRRMVKAHSYTRRMGGSRTNPQEIGPGGHDNKNVFLGRPEQRRSQAARQSRAPDRRAPEPILSLAQLHIRRNACANAGTGSVALSLKGKQMIACLTRSLLRSASLVPMSIVALILKTTEYPVVFS